MKFIQLDKFHSYIETEGLIIEFVFFLKHFEPSVKLEFFRSSHNFGTKRLS